MVSHKLSKVFFLIKILQNIFSHEVLKLIHFRLAESTLTYILIFWGALTHFQIAFDFQTKITCVYPPNKLFFTDVLYS